MESAHFPSEISIAVAIEEAVSCLGPFRGPIKFDWGQSTRDQGVCVGEELEGFSWKCFPTFRPVIAFLFFTS